MMEVIVDTTKGVYREQIVRCKECKHWCKGDDVYGICHRCPNTRQMRLDDFCSYGCRHCGADMGMKGADDE